MHRTESGQKWSTAEEHVRDLAGEDEFFRDYLHYQAAGKLVSTYLRKMNCPRLYPRFGFLLASGRTCGGGGFNLQNLPREVGEKQFTNTIRGCFVPGEGKLFVDADYSQIELAVLAQSLRTQFGLQPKLAELINAEQDAYRLLAAMVLGKHPDQVTKEERNAVKAISFGRPGGMGARQLKRIAKNNYGILLSDEEVEERIQAYHRLCPELDTYLHDDIDIGLIVAEHLRLTPAEYRLALGSTVTPAPRRPINPRGGWVACS
jgi:DNA polymerase-1